MATAQTPHSLEDEELEGRLIIRRFTDELAGSNELERLTKAAQAEIDEEEEKKERQRLRLLYESPGNSGDVDFIASDTARNMLQKMVTEFVENEKPSVLQRMGFKHESAKSKANKMLQDMITSDVATLKASIDGLEEDWKKNNGTAAKNHSEIAELLADSVSRISETVARVSKITLVFPTAAVRQKLADVYAVLFRFYRRAIAWYLQKKVDRALASFNESLRAGFESAEAELGREIAELYREADIGGHAVVATVDRKVDGVGRRIDDVDRKIDYMYAVLRRQRSDCEAEDLAAGRRMLDLLWDHWMEKQARQLGPAEQQQQQQRLPATEPAPHALQGKPRDAVTLARAREYSAALERYIVGDEGPATYAAGRSWVAEDGVLPKLRAWMVGGSASRALWISSPPDLGGMTSAQASALAVWAAAWKAKTPLISHFCQRPRRDQLREGMSTEQVGLMGLVYSLLCQLLQFRRAEDTVNVSEESLKALNGEKGSWETSLKVLEALLGNTPVLMYCVIDGLNDLEFGDGAQWCQQLLKVLFARQRVAGVTFNILLTTAGQSRLLASAIGLEDRYIAQRPARELERWGERIELEAQVVELEE
ncbi:hypothetical protein Hte_006388 [Hypoxylon texense]